MSHMNATPTIIQVQNLTKTYSKTNTKPVVSGISLSVSPGEILSLLGPNGAGKTTIIKMIAGLVLPTSGTATVMGYDVVSERQKAISHIGAVLEGARNLYWRLSAIENMRYFGNLRLVPPRELENRIDELLELFDLTEHRNKEVGQFSRGMQQKLAIAVALLHDPNVLLLDEPTLGLDIKSARLLENAILTLVKQKNKAVILTTHMMELAEKIAETVYVVHNGREVAYGALSEILHEHDHQKNILEIRVFGRLVKAVKADIETSFAGISIRFEDELSILTWPSVGQVELLKILDFLNEQSIQIIEVKQRKPSLEEVFLLLTED